MMATDVPRWGRTVEQLTEAESRVLRSIGRGVEPKLRYYGAALDLKSFGLLRCVLGRGESVFILTDAGRSWLAAHPEIETP